MRGSERQGELYTWTWDELEAEVVRLEDELAAGAPPEGEVAPRAIAALFEVFDGALGRARVDALLREAELTPSRLRQGGEDWFAWSDYEAFLEAMGAGVSDVEARLLGASVMSSPWLRFILQGVRSLPLLEASLRWSARVAFGPGSVVFRGVEYSVRRVRGRFIEVRYAPPHGGSFPRLWRALTHGALERFVELAGGRPDRLESGRDGATIVFRLEASAPATGRLRALVSAGVDSLGGGLEQARAELDIRNRELRRRIAEREAAERGEIRLEARLTARREQDAVGRLAAGVAHDLNNLLGAMTMQLDLLRTSLRDDEGALAELAPMVEAVDLGTRRAHELMQLGRDLSDRDLAVDELEQRGLPSGSGRGASRAALIAQIRALRGKLAASEPPLSPPAKAPRAAVSWRNVPDTIAAAEALGLAREDLLAGLSWRYDESRSPDSWVPWPDFIELLDRIEELAGEEGLRGMGGQALESPLFAAVGAIAGAFFDEAELFDWILAHVFGPESTYFSGLPGRLEVHGPRELHVVWESEGATMSRALAVVLAGIVANTPRLVGRPAADTTVEVNGTSIRVRARLARRDSVMHRLARIAGRARAAEEAEALRAIYGELLSQNQRLEEKAAELEVARRRRRALERRLEEVRPMVAASHVAAQVAHDFNNALTVVAGHLELLQLHLSDIEPYRADFEMLEDISQRIGELTKKLRVIGQSETTQGRPLDVAARLRDLAPLLRGIVEGRCALTSSLPTCVGGSRIDAESLERVVMNLVVNARDAEAMAIELRLEEVHLDETFVAAHPGARRGPHVLLEVRDDGEGMPEDVRARAFEPYFTTKAHGSGVGLATVFGLVHQVEGTIWIESKPGEGTAVRVYLPAVELEDAPTSTRSKAPPSSSAPRAAELLVIDDDDTIRELLARLLRGRGHAVATAASGDDAIAQVRAGLRPVMVVSDVVMPGLRGRALADALRGELGPLPILFISGFSDQPLTLGRREAFLAKPFRSDDLFACLDALLDETRSVEGG